MTNNCLSVDRSLDKSLYLLTKQTIGGKDHWLFPQIAFNEEDKSLRQSAERLLDSYFPKTAKGEASIYTKFLGNCPAILYSYRYPKEYAESSKKIGARVFIFKCNLDPNYSGKHKALSGNFGEKTLKPNGVKEYSWFTRNEIQQNVPEQYWKDVSKTVFPDVLIDLEKIFKNQDHKVSKISNRLQKIETKLASSSVN